MSKLLLRFKTLCVATLLFVLSWVLFIFLFRIPLIHSFYEILESFIYFQTFVSTAMPNEHIILVDEEQNAYDRATFARLIAELNSSGAKVIALDVLFKADKDSSQNAKLIEATLKASDKVIHAVEFLDRENQAVIPKRFHLKIPDKPSPENYIENIRGADLPFEDLLEVTKHLGHVLRTSDMTLREAQSHTMILQHNGRLYPSLPLLTVMKFWGCRTDTLSQEPYEFIEFVGDTANEATYPVPINSKAQTLINFIPPELFSGKKFSVERTLELLGNESTIFQNKIVLIGNTFDSLEQMHGPHFRTYPNLIIFATLISQILNDQNIREGIGESLLISYAFVIAGLIVLLFVLQKFRWLKQWHIYFLPFLLLLFSASAFLNFGIKIFVVLPYCAFIISAYLSKKYYDKKPPEERIRYLDYYLTIGPKKEIEDFYPVFLIDSPAGEGYCELRFPKDAGYFMNMREILAQNPNMDLKKLKEFGSALFDGLFQPEIRDKYYKSLGKASGQGARLRIKLRIDAPDLQSYPWEYMYDKKQEREFLSLADKLSITRFVAISEPVEKSFLSPPLKILVIIANPDDNRYDKLDARKEKMLIQKSLHNLEKRGIVQLRFLEEPTLAGLEKALTEKFAVIHFVGHGGFSKTLGGSLIFENSFRKAEVVNIDRIRLLLEKTGLRLVVLNACHTAETSESDISVGVAQGLVETGIPAVIANQFKISDESAIVFSESFYKTLADTFQIDRAVSEARRKVFINFGEGNIDWGFPVLFMRKDDGILFDSTHGR